MLKSAALETSILLYASRMTLGKLLAAEPQFSHPENGGVTTTSQLVQIGKEHSECSWTEQLLPPCPVNTISQH